VLKLPFQEFSTGTSLVPFDLAIAQEHSSWSTGSNFEIVGDKHDCSAFFMKLL
jgi:hypothetical protein